MVLVGEEGERGSDGFQKDVGEEGEGDLMGFKMTKVPLWVYNQVWLHKSYKQCNYSLLVLTTLD